MKTYIAWLRGINVGGHKKIKMETLRALLESLGLQNVKTYIQSGNVIFQSAEEETRLQKRIESKIIEEFGFEVTVMLRTQQELEDAIQEAPFKADELKDGETLHIVFLSEKPADAAVDVLVPYKNEDLDYEVMNRELYLLYRKSMRDIKFPVQKLKIPGTMRNWNTVNKMATMGKAIDQQ
ncbi:DUF1697 domain-containing protein [Fictibacillus terranigra]|uniref:DUF1697 domain-containing protein n=1 Tax=Fictibacillus terranigra TaxID=3058424 RepID=A0ABT8E7Z2_9BACL|nr:DUF1697 domain-containing protein [Fictibacillus sp. CENA-BCM004]MDN4074019.1 DUF1697 domain-containing protein [Fictibacillus sp. CENA-BCM004]